MSEELLLKLSQLQPSMQSVNTTAILIDSGQIRRTNTGTVLVMRVADSSGSINLTIINPEFSETWKAGDILRIKNGYTNIYQGGLTLTIGRASECMKTHEFFMTFTELPYLSEPQAWPNVVEKSRPLSDNEGNEKRGVHGGINRKTAAPTAGNPQSARGGHYPSSRGRF